MPYGLVLRLKYSVQPSADTQATFSSCGVLRFAPTSGAGGGKGSDVDARRV
jgi:hypothetical protein